MKRIAAAIIFVFSVSASFAGDAAPAQQDLAQNQTCAARCQMFFSQCLQVCGSNCTTAGISAAITGAATSNAATTNTTATAARTPTVFRNCDGEQSLCLISCSAAPNG